MSDKHTPGPWAWDEGRNYLRAADPDPSTSAVHTILDVEYGYTGYIGSARHDTRTEGEANFALIAAAPELLAALERINEWCCYATEEDTAARLLALQQIGQAARAAITKATGGAA